MTLVVMGSLGLWNGAVALAARPHVFSEAFGGSGSGASELELAAPGFNEAGEENRGGSGVAVNEATGDVYVADTGNHRVDEFSASGLFVRAFGYGVADGTTEALETCTVTCFKGLGGSKAGELETPTFVAIDNSGGESEGDVYVADTSANLVTKYTSEGALVSLWGNNGKGAPEEPNGQLRGSAAEPFGVPECSLGPFCEPPLRGIAVNNAGDLWVDSMQFNLGGQHPTLYEFEAGGAFVTEWKDAEGETLASLPSGLTVDGAEDIFDAEHHGGAARWTPSGERIGLAFPEEHTFTGLAVDSAGLYLDERNAVRAIVLGCPPPSERCVIAESFGSSQLGDEGGAGVAADGATGAVYVADGVSNLIDAFALEPEGAPSVESVSVSDVTGDSAKLQAEVNPRGLPSTARFEYGPCTTPSTCASSPFPVSMPAVPAGSEFVVATISPVNLQGLAPNTIYHYRVVAENHKGMAEAEGTFTTQASGALSLIDGRAWEMVSPPDKQGALILPLNNDLQPSVIEASASGGTISYLTNTPTEREPAGYTNDQQVLSTRGVDGWASRDLSVAHSEETSLGVDRGQEYRFFSRDLSHAIVQPFGRFTPLSSEASEATSYLENLPCDSSNPKAAYQAGSCFRPLVTDMAGFIDDTASPFVPFGIANQGFLGGSRTVGNLCPPELTCGPLFDGASADAEHIALGAEVPLAEPAPPIGTSGLYEWSDGTLRTVSTLPPAEGGEPVFGLLGSPTKAASNETTSGADAQHAISEDGSRVFWTGGVDLHLYLRYNATQPPSPIHEGSCEVPADACTIRLDVPAPKLKEAGAGAEFQGASPDGSRVWFTDTNPLTVGAGGIDNLYECEIVPSAHGGHECHLRDVAAAAEGAEAVVGRLIGTSEEGCEAGKDDCNVYFVADTRLAAGAEEGTCKDRIYLPNASCNLYVVHNAEAPKLIAVLSGEDGPDWGGVVNNLPYLAARTSANGRWLTFVSNRELTGYDNRDPVTGKPAEEIYVYDAQTGRLACASCEPTGARPNAIATTSEGRNAPLVDSGNVWEPGTEVAAMQPPWESYSDEDARYQPRFLTDSGRVFFDSLDGLVSKDVNNQWDVYEWEPESSENERCHPGVTSGGEVYKTVHFFEAPDGEGQPPIKGEEGAGCVGLISSGNSRQESAFLDASESGNEVFFMTSAQLSTQDYDEAYDVYDAHECTSESPCIAPPALPAPECATAEACRGASNLQPLIYGPPPSATFSGQGNISPPSPSALPKVRALSNAEKLKKALRTCHKDRSRRKRQACERTAHRRYGQAKAKKSQSSRRTSR